MLHFRLITFVLTAFGLVAAVRAEPREALSLVQAECFGCHSPEKKKGDVILTSRVSLLPHAEKILAAVQHKADPHMPPKKQLSTNQIALLRDWLAKGAPWQEIEAVPVKLSPLPPNYRPSFALAMASNKVAVSRGALIQVYSIESNR